MPADSRLGCSVKVKWSWWVVSVTKLSKQHVHACPDQKRPGIKITWRPAPATQNNLRKLDAESTSKFATLQGGRYNAQILVLVCSCHSQAFGYSAAMMEVMSFQCWMTWHDMSWSTRICRVCRRDRNHDFDAFPFNTLVEVLEWRDMMYCSESLRAFACCTCLPILAMKDFWSAFSDCLCLCFWSWDDFVLTAAKLFKHRHSDFWSWNPSLDLVQSTAAKSKE